MLAYTAWLRPADRFGFYHDDTLYFSSAQALAEGRGYIIPSLPGQPRQSKYPVLYSWLLSWVWRWNPSFPANLGAAVGLSALFACGYLVAAYCLVGGAAGLAIAGLCAFHPVVLFLAGSVLSDMPFSALALGGIVVADRAIETRPRPAALVAAGALLGLATAIRTLGIMILAGVAVTALYRRLPRRAVAIVAVAVPFAALSFLFGGSQPAPDGPPGWRQTWLFYTSYGAFWKLSVPSAAVLGSMVLANFQYWLQAPATYCLFPTLGEGSSMAGTMLQVSLAVGILAGVARQARQVGWRPIHFCFALYSVATWFWNYALMDRFLLPFLPLLYQGLWAESRHLMGALRRPRTRADRVVAGVLLVGLLAVATKTVRHYATGFRSQLHEMAARRAALGSEKNEAYSWIRARTPPSTRFVAYEDASLYLHTGRQAVRPIVFSTEAFYRKDEAVLARDLDRILEAGRAIQARYWLMAADDFRLETGRPRIDERIARLQATLLPVFQSSGGRVRIYQMGSP
jgi:hypothetical protein